VETSPGCGRGSFVYYFYFSDRAITALPLLLASIWRRMKEMEV